MIGKVVSHHKMLEKLGEENERSNQKTISASSFQRNKTCTIHDVVQGPSRAALRMGPNPEGHTKKHLTPFCLDDGSISRIMRFQISAC
jgi:hypothetical protein